MPRSVEQRVPVAEVKRSHRDAEGVSDKVKKLHDLPLVMAKGKVGRCVSAAIGNEPLKAFGHEGLMSEVCSGAKVPDYLARIYQNRPARRRLALALLDDDTDVVVTTTITVPTK